MYPIQFVVYKHSSYAPQAKQGFSWSNVANLFYNFIGEPLLIVQCKLMLSDIDFSYVIIICNMMSVLFFDLICLLQNFTSAKYNTHEYHCIIYMTCSLYHHHTMIQRLPNSAYIATPRNL